MAQKNFATLLITTGDIDGIGVEVAAKALKKKFASLRCNAIVYLDKKSLRQFKQFYPTYCPIAESVSEALTLLSSKKPSLILLVSKASPAHWVLDAATLSYKNPTSFALVTGPMSKPLLEKYFPGKLGHTDLLKDLCKNQNLYMGFLGRHFHVLLATGHIPLEKVPAALTPERMKSALHAAESFRKIAGVKKPIGLLGLNPHAGDAGLIGAFESQTMTNLLSYSKKNKLNVIGPLIPDSAFLPEQQKRVGVYLALYHDQGLIPFKLIHGQDSGAHVTVGLPFVRTSVDHGTAKDIFSKGIANANSMIDALVWAKRLIGAQK